MALLHGSTATYTHAGRRRSNQDAVVVRTLGADVELISVADGMGGHLAGEVASAMALETLVARLEAGDTLEVAVQSANARVHGESQANPEYSGMGTTLVALLRSRSEYWIANVGDSRAYRVDEAGIHALTDDHSYIAEAVRGGAMTAEAAARSPWRNALTRSIGTEATVAVDLFGPFSSTEPHAVLLCSDGLYKAVDDDVIREYVLSTGAIGEAVEMLAALAYRRGSDDNISVAMAEFGHLPRRPPQITLPLPIGVQAAGAAQAGRPRKAAAPTAADPESAPTPPPLPSERPAPSPAEAPAEAPAPPRTPRHSPLIVGTGPVRKRRRRGSRRRRRARITGMALILAAFLLLGFLLTAV
jgi:PPM family protein phosphatase